MRLVHDRKCVQKFVLPGRFDQHSTATNSCPASHVQLGGSALTIRCREVADWDASQAKGAVIDRSIAAGRPDWPAMRVPIVKIIQLIDVEEVSPARGNAYVRVGRVRVAVRQTAFVTVLLVLIMNHSEQMVIAPWVPIDARIYTIDGGGISRSSIVPTHADRTRFSTVHRGPKRKERL